MAPPKRQSTLDAFIQTTDDSKKTKKQKTQETESAKSASTTASPELSDDSLKVQIGESWFEFLRAETEKPYFTKMMKQIETLRQSKTIFPPEDCVFRAFQISPLDSIKVVIVGQDPYHGPGQAMGLSFSVPRGVKAPPSLVNMLKEAGVSCTHGDLTSWAEQGVFLMNNVLTVERGTPNSHEKFGWTQFTDAVIDTLNKNTTGTIFLLWGKHAQKKGSKISREKHVVLESGHPSPLSIKHFKGCDHFNLCNEKLEEMGKNPIVWTLPE